MKRSLATATLVSLTFALFGCAGKPPAASTEYEWVTPTGSNIAVKVPKGQRAAVGTSPTATVGAEEMSKIVNASAKVPTDRGN